MGRDPSVPSTWVSTRVRDLVAPMADRDIRLLWFARVLSEVGDWASRLALSYLVYWRTDSPSATALVMALSLLPWLGVGQLLSTLADRYEHRIVMAVSDVFRVVMFLVLAWVPMPTVVLLALVFVAACASPPFEAARSAALPELSESVGYTRSLRLFNATHQAGLLVGFAAGGGLVKAFGPPWSLTVNAATFLVSAVLILMIRRRTSAATAARRAGEQESGAAGGGPLSHVREAARVYLRDPMMLSCLLVAIVAIVPLAGAEALIVVYADVIGGGGPVMAGLMSAAIAAAALVAMVGFPAEVGHRRLLVIATVLCLASLTVTGGLLVIAPGFLSGYLPLLALGAISCLALPLGTMLGERSPRRVRGTVFSMAQGAAQSTQALGAVLAGVMASGMALNHALALLCLPGILASLIGLRVALRREPEAVAGETDDALSTPSQVKGASSTGGSSPST